MSQVAGTIEVQGTDMSIQAVRGVTDPLEQTKRRPTGSRLASMTDLTYASSIGGVSDGFSIEPVGHAVTH